MGNKNSRYPANNQTSKSKQKHIHCESELIPMFLVVSHSYHITWTCISISLH